jgi:hypothetical protein
MSAAQPLKSGEPVWRTAITERMERLLELPENWDSYGASRIDPRAVAAAVELLDTAMRADTPEPTVVPSPRGGVQLEWHTHSIDLEIEIPPTGPFHASFENFDTNSEWEDDLQLDLAPVIQAIAELSRPA